MRVYLFYGDLSSICFVICRDDDAVGSMSDEFDELVLLIDNERSA